MVAIIRKLPSGTGFKLSYKYGERIEIINFYHSSSPELEVYGIIRDDKIMNPKNNLDRLLEVIRIDAWAFEERNEIALFRVYEHVKNYVKEHSFVSNQPLVDKTRFADTSEFKQIELNRKIHGREIFSGIFE